MKPKRVMVLESDHLLGAGISSLLSARHDLEVREAMIGDRDLFERMAEFEPEVIVVDEATVANSLSVCSRLFQAHPAMRMIILNPRTNTLRVCRRQLVVVETIDDFLSLL